MTTRWRIEDFGCDAAASIIAKGNLKVSDHSPQPQPLLASGWQRECGLMIMKFGICLGSHKFG